MTHPHRSPLLGGLALAVLVLGTSSVERLDLRRMVERTDGAIAGRIVSAWTTWNPSEASEARIFTHLRIVGVDLYTGKRADTVVSFFGGAYDGQVQWHPDMPTAADTKVGTSVLAFAKWHPTMGGIGMRGIYACFAGLFRLEEGPRGEVVIGRGEGFAVEKNVPLAELRAQVARHRGTAGPR